MKKFLWLAATLLVLALLAACAAPAPTPAPTTKPAPAPAPAPAPTASPSPVATATPKPAPAPTAAAKPKTFKLITWRLNAPDVNPMVWDLVKKLEERSNGLLKFNLLGSEEVVPMMQQSEALRSGMADIVWLPAGYVAGVPEGTAVGATPRTPEEQRKSGFYDFINEAFAKKDIYYLTVLDPSVWQQNYIIYLTKPIAKPEDLKGMKIRSSVTYSPLLQSFGAVTVSIPQADTYSAMERGLVLGYGGTLAGAFDYGLQDIAKYYVTPGFGVNQVAWFFNLNVWKSISPEMQKLIKDTQYELEKVWAPKFVTANQAMFERLDKYGVKNIVFSKEDGQKWQSKYYEAAWAEVIKQSPVNGPRLKTLAGM